MWYMGVDKSGCPNGWDTEPWGEAIKVSDDIRALHEAHPNYVWDGSSLIDPSARPPLSQAEQEAADQAALQQFRADCALALDQLKNDHARGKDYGTPSLSPLASVRSKAGYPGPYQAECLVFVAWEDACQLVSYQIINDVLAGVRSPPATVEDFLAELPELDW